MSLKVSGKRKAVSLDFLHCESNKLCQPNLGYNFVNFLSICKFFILLPVAQTLLFRFVLNFCGWSLNLFVGWILSQRFCV